MFILHFLFTFAMVRRHLYHTLEEKIAANHAKSKWFYDKCMNNCTIFSITLGLGSDSLLREKDIINKNHHKKYAKAHKKSGLYKSLNYLLRLFFYQIGKCSK